VWEVKVASGRRRPDMFLVAASGRKIVRRSRSAKLGDVAPAVLKARVSLAGALRAADRRVGECFSEAVI